MVAKTIQALRENKLHEVIIRISQMTFEQLGELAVGFLANDYTLMYRIGKDDDEIEYQFDLPDAYELSFYLMEDAGDYVASIYFSTNKPSQMYDEDKDILFIFKHRRVYSINMLNRGKGWKYEGMQGNRKKLFHLLTEYV